MTKNEKDGLGHNQSMTLTKLDGAMVEPCLADAKAGDKFQFVRVGYFCKDSKNEGTFNRVVGLKDSFPAKK